MARTPDRFVTAIELLERGRGASRNPAAITLFRDAPRRRGLAELGVTKGRRR